MVLVAIAIGLATSTCGITMRMSKNVKCSATWAAVATAIGSVQKRSARGTA